MDKEYIIISAELTNNGFEIVKRYPSKAFYSTNPPSLVPDIIIKEIYNVVDGKICLFGKIEAKVTPAYTVKELIEFTFK